MEKKVFIWFFLVREKFHCSHLSIDRYAFDFRMIDICWMHFILLAYSLYALNFSFRSPFSSPRQFTHIFFLLFSFLNEFIWLKYFDILVTGNKIFTFKLDKSLFFVHRILTINFSIHSLNFLKFKNHHQHFWISLSFIHHTYHSLHILCKNIYLKKAKKARANEWEFHFNFFWESIAVNSLRVYD